MNPHLEYAAYNLKKRCNGCCDKTRFYKLLYLLDCELTEIGYGLDIPCYWYQDGVMVKDAEHLFYLRKRDLFDILPQDEKNDMDKALEQFLKEHKSKTIQQLQGELFKEAPFPFQNEFRKLLSVVRGWKGKGSLDNYFNCGNADTLNLLKKLEKTFPQNEFEDLYPLFLEWKTHTEYMVKHDKSRVETGLLVEKFSFIFNKKLKIVANENIDPKTVTAWKSEYEKARIKFEKFLLDFPQELHSE